MSNFPKWFSAELRKCTICKNKTHKLYKLTGDLEHYLNFVSFTICTNPQYFWKRVKESKNVYRLPSSMKYHNVTSRDSQDILNLFADYFATVYSNDHVNQIPEHTLCNVAQML
nr:unnamed protein product [Callosobruchus analis]